jgi:hypothetical protein
MTTARTKSRYVPPTTSRVLASTLGTLPASVLASAALARLVPTALPASFAVGYLLWLPIWIAAICWAARAPGARRAWLFCLVFTALAAAGALALPH